MKNIKKVFLISLPIFLTFVLFFAPAVKADAIWNLTGNYTIDFFCTKGCSGTYTHHMNVTSMNLATGDFYGTGDNLPGTTKWTINNGKVNGSNVSFIVDYNSSAYYVDVIGTINSNGLMSGSASNLSQNFTWSTTAGAATFNRHATITAPVAGNVNTVSVDFKAYLFDDDHDSVSWAVRRGICTAGTNTVFGNVDGYNNIFSWVYDQATYTHTFSATANTATWPLGMYCFVFNPSEDSGESDIRLTREFSFIPPADKIERLGVNRHIWDGTRWETLMPKGKSGETVLSTITMKQTYGYNCTQILDVMSEATGESFGGHYKFGCSKSVIEAWIDGKYFMEKILVNSANVDGASSKVTLSENFDYYLVVSGTWINRLNPTEYVDAKYTTRDDWTNWSDAPLGGYAETLLELKVDDKFVDWGAYSPDHIYKILYSGLGQPIHFKVNDSYYGDNNGVLSVDIYAKLHNY